MESDKMMGEIEKAKALGLPLWADALSDAVFIHDWQGRIFFSNQVGCSWLGVDQAAVGSVNLFAEVSLDVCRLRERLNQSGELSFELQLSDGRFLDIRAYANLFPFDGEEIVVSIARDVTARKRWNESIRNRRNGSGHYSTLPPILIFCTISAEPSWTATR